jgi:transcriptional regulator with XRE-family HTH domain
MNKIKEIRQRLKMTQKQFGELLGVGQSAVAQWESGENFPATMQLYRLSELSGESMTELLKDRLNQQKK